ncbi:hypothetical protein HN51_057779 [Arachis hypogaea]
MDSIDYQISPKLARLRRRLIMKQKIRERNQRSFETGLSTAIVQYPFLPLKRPATSLRKYSSNSTEENVMDSSTTESHVFIDKVYDGPREKNKSTSISKKILHSSNDLCQPLSNNSIV